MPYGLRVFNESAERIVDTDYGMTFLHSMQDFTTLDNDEGLVTLSFSGLNNQPIVLGSVISGFESALNFRVYKSALLWDRVDIKYIGPGIKTIRIWIFARSEGGATSGYGIRTYRADGSLSFESSRQMLRLHSSFSGTYTGTIITHTFPPLSYPPPVALNRRYFCDRYYSVVCVGLGEACDIEEYFLAWRLLKDVNNQYYALEIDLATLFYACALLAPCPSDACPNIFNVGYSGFIFKYQ